MVKIDNRFTNEQLIGKIFRCKNDDFEYGLYLYGEPAEMLEIEKDTLNNQEYVTFYNKTVKEVCSIPIEQFTKDFELFA